MLPRLAISKEPSRPNQQALTQQLTLFFRIVNDLNVFINCAASVQRTAVMHPSAQRRRFIVREIDILLVCEQRNNLF